jgi:hypothetical protein
MSFFATNYYPLSENFFAVKGAHVVKMDGRRPVIGMHIFKWNPEVSTIKIKTTGGSIINFTGNALVEGAVYWIGVAEVLEMSGTAQDTEIHGIISTLKTV